MKLLVIITVLVAVALAIYLLILSIVVAYGLAVAVGIPTLQLLTGGVSAVSAVGSAIAAFLIYRGNKLSRTAMEEWSKTLVQPKIFVYGSTRGARKERIGVGEGRLTETQLEIGGIFVENIGLGPAVKGVVYVLDQQGNRIPVKKLDEKYTFRRIAPGYWNHFPSYDSPEMEQYVRGRRKIRLQMSYFDIKGNPYRLQADEEEVDLSPQ